MRLTFVIMRPDLRDNAADQLRDNAADLRDNAADQLRENSGNLRENSKSFVIIGKSFVIIREKNFVTIGKSFVIILMYFVIYFRDNSKCWYNPRTQITKILNHASTICLSTTIN